MADILIYTKIRPVVRRVGVQERLFKYRTEYYYSPTNKEVYTTNVDENYYQFSYDPATRLDAFVFDLAMAGGRILKFVQRYHDGSGGLTDTFSDVVSAVLTPTHVLCNGAATGAIVVSGLSGGSGQYAYQWSDGATTANRVNVPAGQYQVLISDAAEPINRYTYQVTVTEPATAITVGGTVTETGCFGSANGRIEVTVLGGTPGPAGSEYTYLWNDGVTTRDRSGLRAGNYQITVTDANGCVKSRNFTVFQNTEILVQATVQESNVTLSVSGGKPGYSFQWSDGATTRDRENLPPGAYTVTVADSVGCRRSVNVSIQAFVFWFSRNFIPLRLVASGPETKANLTFLCEVHLEETYGSGAYRKVYEMELPAGLDNSATFDVQPILDAYLSPYLPEGVENRVTLARPLFRRFFLQYTERFGTPPVTGSYSQADVSTVVLGGLSYEEYAAKTFFSSYLKNQRPFFTWAPRSMDVFVDQPEFLYYLVDELSAGSFRTVVRIHYADGTNSAYVFHTQAGANRYEMYCIPAGYGQLQLEQYQPGKAIAGWDVLVTNGAGNQVSETRSYRLRTDYAPERRYFLYLNSLGGYNTLACTGRARTELDPEVQQIEKILQPGYAISGGETVVMGKFGRPSLKVSTGYVGREQMQALQDFVISESVFFYDRGRYVPGTVDPKSVVITDEDETLSKLEFEFSLPKMYRYTPRL